MKDKSNFKIINSGTRSAIKEKDETLFEQKFHSLKYIFGSN
jgi:hypothetical protein